MRWMPQAPSYFNPRPHTKGDSLFWPLRQSFVEFQSSPPHKGRPSTPTLKTGHIWISILAPTQRATSYTKKGDAELAFQSSPPHKGRPVGTCLGFTSDTDFNPRPHTKGDQQLRLLRQHYPISILAPTQRATSHIREFVHASIISILAPTQRATGASTQSGAVFGDFNPRPHTKGDHRSILLRQQGKISILAPTQRATTELDRQLDEEKISILAPTQRATCGAAGGSSPMRISILAPTQRATSFPARCSPCHPISILAPTQRATSHRILPQLLMVPFQSSPPHKGRPVLRRRIVPVSAFQSSPPHKGRLFVIFPDVFNGEFQSSPPHKGRPLLPSWPR